MTKRTLTSLIIAAAAFAAAGVGAQPPEKPPVAPTSNKATTTTVSTATAPSSAVGMSTATAFALESSTAAPPPQYTWTVDDVVAIALRDNPDVQSARANFEAARRVVGESVSGYLPSVDGYGFSGRATLPTPSAGVNAEGLLGRNRPYTDGMVGIKQTLFDFGKGLENIEAAKSERGSAEQQMLGLRNLIVLNAQRAFYDVAASERLVEVAQKSLAKFQETYRRADVLVKTGTRPPFDLTQAQVELSKAELALINAKNARDLAKIALLNIMGMDKLVTFALKDQASGPWPIQAAQLDRDRLMQRALDARPEMKESRFNVEAAHYRLREIGRDYLPTFTADAWYGRFLPDYPESIRGSFSFGVQANWNLFDGFGTTFRVKELEARIDQQKALLKKQSQSIMAEVAASYMNLVRAEQNETVAQEGLTYAKENFRYARLRYDADVGTILELLVAETSLVNAEAVEVQARYRHATALDALQRAVNAPLLDASK